MPPTLSARLRAAPGAARRWMPGTRGGCCPHSSRRPHRGGGERKGSWDGGTYLRCERPGRSHPRPSYSRRAASGVDTASGAADGGGRGKPAARFPARLSSSSNLEPQRAPISPPPAPPPAPVGHTQPRPISLPFSVTTGLAPAGKSRGRSRRPVLEAQLSPTLTGDRLPSRHRGAYPPWAGCKSSRVLLQPHQEALGKESPRNNLLCCSPLCPQHHDIRSHPVDSGSPGFLGLSPPRRDLRNEAQTEGSKGWRALP